MSNAVNGIVITVCSYNTRNTTRSSAMAEGLRDALVSIEKKLAIDECPWYTPR